MTLPEIFQELFTRSLFKYVERVLGKLPEDKEELRSFAKAHEGDWYKSDEFAEMFIQCPAEAIPFVARRYYGNGHAVKAGVDLSGRVVECLKSAFKQFKQEQATFPDAFIVETTLKAFGVVIDEKDT